MASLSFCDFSDSSESTTPPTSIPPMSTFRSPLQGPNAPRLDVDWSDSPPLSLSLRFSGIFSEADLEGDVTRRTHESRSVSLDMSYDVQTFPNLKDVLPDFANDSDISEVLMTPKLPATLSTIPEAVEPSPVLTYTTSLSDFDILNIGNTSEAGTCVMVCKRKKTGKMYKIRCRRDYVPWTEQDILETLRDLGAPFLPHLRSSFREDGRVHLVLDHLPSGSLRELVERTGTLTSQRVLFYASEIIVGISNLHSIGIMHRNLNPDDILFDPSGHVVISNFGLADFVASSGMNARTFSGGFFQYPKAQCYQAPEVLLGWAHDSVVDCWGYGMVLYFMFFGKHPFKSGIGPEGSEDLQARVIEGTLSPDSLRLIHPQTRDLILKCIERNPRVRLTLDEIKRHGFFANVSWTRVADRQVEVPPFPGPFEQYAPATRYTSGPPPAMDVRPLRIEKKASRSPVATGAPSHTFGSAFGAESKPSPRPSEGVRMKAGEDVDPPATARGGSGVEIWDILDQEEQQHQQAMSLRSGRNFMSFFKPRTKQQRTGSIYGPKKNLFLNLSTASFSRITTRKATATTSSASSTPSLCRAPPPESIGGLPLGVQQIGSGFGFSYNLPTMPRARQSRISIGSGTTPLTCHNIFGSGSRAQQQERQPVKVSLGLGSLAIEGLTPGAYIFEPPATTTDSQAAAATTTWMQPPYQGGPPSTLSSPESDDGPFTPTAMDCEDGLRGKDHLEPDMTLRLVTRTPYA